MKKDAATLGWIYQQSKHVIIYLVIITVIGVFLSVLGVSFALVSKNVVDIASSRVTGSVVRASADLALLIIAQLAFQIATSKIHIIAVGKLNMSISRGVFEKLLYKSYPDVSGFHSGELINRINSDVRVVTGGIVDIVPDGLSLLSRAALSFWALLTLDRTFAVICLVVGVVVFPASRLYRKKIKELYKRQQESDGVVRSFMQECLQNLLVIKSFGNEKMIVGHSADLQQKNYFYTVKKNNISIIANMLFYITVTAGFYFALAWGAYKLSIGLISYGTLTAMLQLIGQIQVPFRGLSTIVPQYYSVIAAAERIIEINELSDEKRLNEKDIDCNYLYENMEEIVFENVSFAYEGANVLDNTNLTIKKNDFILISGISGTGKSTFLKLLLGIISPTGGSIHIKLTTGEKIPLDGRTRKLFAYVPQGNMILSGTIRDNICFSGERKDDSVIEKCAQVAQIWDFIDSLPDKLDTMLGENGLGLSEGQVQRIAIARAIYHNAPIILLDEATSALDEKTEASLLSEIKDLKGRTCIVVSHRRAAFEICHKTAAIEKGKFKLLNI